MKQTIAFFFLFLMLLSIPAAALRTHGAASFYEAHSRDCPVLMRLFYANGAQGYITAYDRPGGKPRQYIENGNRLKINYTYSLDGKQWGMITDEPERWVRMEALYQCYDGISFQEEFEKEIKQKSGIHSDSPGRGLYFYAYPGDADPERYVLEKNETIAYNKIYTDPEGKLWGYVNYFRGAKGAWICLDGPGIQQKPFGGVSLPSDGLIPAKEPPRFSPDPLVLTAIILVLLAALLLLKFCYRNKKKSDAPTDT